MTARNRASAAGLVNRVLAGSVNILPGEGRSVLAAGMLFFLVLAAVMILRPVRDALGVQQGMDFLRRVFLLSVGVLLAAMLIFGYVVARVPRGVFMAASFRFCALALVGFFACLAWLPASDTAKLGPAYFVFHGVFNLFVVSLFWALMADLFSAAESQRLFPAIAIGGTLGAIAGAALARHLVQCVPVYWLFLIAAAMLEAAVWMGRIVTRIRGPQKRSAAARTTIGGSGLAGLTALVRSPYLLGIGLFVLLTASTSTLLFFTKIRVVLEAADSFQQRTVLLARIEFWGQVATLLAQALLTGRILRYLGVGTALAVLPLLAMPGFALLAAVPTITACTLVIAAFRAALNGIIGPARETLFTVVSREDKYKAKPVLDTLVFRLGDVCGLQLEGVLPSLTFTAVVMAPIGAAWMGLSFALGRSQVRRAASPAPPPATPTAVGAGTVE